jgi:hypothetical protein
MMVGSPAEARVLVIGRAAGHRCVFCGEPLPGLTREALGRICPRCIAPDSAPALRMASALGVRVPRQVAMGERWRGERTIKSSYWVLQAVWGPFPGLGPGGWRMVAPSDDDDDDDYWEPPERGSHWNP